MKNSDVKKQVERGLSSVGRLRILRILANGENASQTKYGLERLTGLKPVDVRKHLKILLEIGWIKEHDYVPPVYTLNFENSKIESLVVFFQKIGYL